MKFRWGRQQSTLRKISAGLKLRSLEHFLLMFQVNPATIDKTLRVPTQLSSQLTASGESHMCCTSIEGLIAVLKKIGFVLDKEG